MTKSIRLASLPQLLAVLALIAPMTGSEAASRLADLPYSTLTAAWGDSNRAWKGIPLEERRARAARFFETFHSSDLCRVCRETVGANEAERTVEGFLKAKFDALPPTTDELVELLQDLTVGPSCHKVVVQYLSRTKDSYGIADGDRLGLALLGVADHAAYPPGVEGMLEIAAAHLSRGDSLLARIERYATSGRPELEMRAVDMMVESKDPRAAALLERTLQGYGAKGTVPPARMIIAAGLRLGPRSYSLLVPWLRTAPDEPTRWKVLEALCYSQDPRAMGHLLAAYGDSALGIRDDTSKLADRGEKDHYFRLWSDTRLLEPTIAACLLRSDLRLRKQALELVDRESRFGIPADPPSLFESLRAYAGVAGQEPGNIKRVMEILARFELREQELPKH